MNERKHIIAWTILSLIASAFALTTYSLYAEKVKIEAKLEQNKTLISVNERITKLEKINEILKDKIKENELQNELMWENILKNKAEMEELKTRKF